MNSDVLIPKSVEELADHVKSQDRILAVGNQTKPPLSRSEECALVSLSALSGMIEYEPSEFTFTAWAGTKLSEIESELSLRGQYLPFDPVFSGVGATLGGTIASGLSGPGRFRYGGLRDFCIGIHWMDGKGRLIQGGGKVVKNAAGFDFPKFMVGSLGRYGILVDVTFKVFPQPRDHLTWMVSCSDHRAAAESMSTLAASRYEVDAIDYRPDLRQLAIRLAGPTEVLPQLLTEIREQWSEGKQLSGEESSSYWQAVNAMDWSPFNDPVIVKVPLNLTSFLKIEKELSAKDSCRLHLSVAGNVAWISLSDVNDLAWLSNLLMQHQLPGLIILGDVDQVSTGNEEASVSDRRYQIGAWPRSKMMQAVKHAMDPLAKFPGV